MTRTIRIGILICLAGLTAFSQAETAKVSGTTSVELTSPFVGNDRNVVFDQALYHRSCLDLLTLERRCGGEQSISYGTRIGVNDSLFNVHGGKASRTRMVEIGKYDWTDQFKVPVVILWSALEPGEQRNVTMNASGADGADGRHGANGMNGDGTYTASAHPAPRPAGKDYANAPVDVQVSAVVKRDGDKVRTDNYNPLVAVKKGHMYALRVFNETTDYYVLVHVDEVVPGKSVVLSFKKLDTPQHIF